MYRGWVCTIVRADDMIHFVMAMIMIRRHRRRAALMYGTPRDTARTFTGF